MSEETPGATVIVTTDTGREIRFRADEWDADEQLDVLTTGRNYVASFAAGRWSSVRLDGAITPDLAARKLGIAMRALEAIGGVVLEAGDPRRALVDDARDALDEIEGVDP